MRARLTVTVILAGCLHAQTPARPEAKASSLAMVARLLQDAETIEEAAELARRRGLTARELAGVAASAHAAYLRMQAYDIAAEIAWRFRLPQAAVEVPFGLERRVASDRIADYALHRDAKDAIARRTSAAWELSLESLIGCRYGARPEDAQQAVEDADAFYRLSSYDRTLYPLLEYGCPVSDTLRDRIIDLAVANAHDDFAIGQAAKAGWTDVKKAYFAWNFFYAHRCGSGFRAAAALKIASDDVAQMVEKSDCEDMPIDAAGWDLPTDQARRYFFAAVRAGKSNLAYALMAYCDPDENYRTFLFQEAMRHGLGPLLIKILRFHPEAHDPLMRYAFDQGRYRFVGMYAQTLDWQRKAFDALLAQGHYDFAGEVAQYGVSESLRTNGIVEAFRAAMAAGDFKAGRYFVARYGPTAAKAGLVTQQMYDDAQKAYYAAHAPPAAAAPPVRKRRAKPARPRCPDDDWCVGDGK